MESSESFSPLFLKQTIMKHLSANKTTAIVKTDSLKGACTKDSDIYKCGAAFDKVNSLYSLTIGLNSSEQLTHDKVYLNNVMIQLAKGGVMSNNDKIKCNRLWKKYKKK